MKKAFLCIFAVFAISSGIFAQQTPVTLDEAIITTVSAIDRRLDKGTIVTVLNFNSPSEKLSDYVIDRLTGELANIGNILVVDRKNLDIIRQEENYQLSGEVSDSTMQSIGQKLGAQSIIVGTFEDTGNYYHAAFRIIEVVSAAIQAQYNQDVIKDKALANLMGTSFSKDPESSGFLLGVKAGISSWIREGGKTALTASINAGYRFTNDLSLLGDISISLNQGYNGKVYLGYFHSIDYSFTGDVSGAVPLDLDFNYTGLDINLMGRYLFFNKPVSPFQFGIQAGIYLAFSPGVEIQRAMD